MTLQGTPTHRDLDFPAGCRPAAAAERETACARSRDCLFVAIPAFNEAKHLAALITGVRAAVPWIEILVIDDGSTDATPELLRRLSVPFIRNDVNAGKGAALQSALAWAKKHGFLWMIAMDGDGQHDPGFIPAFIREIYQGQADFIIGCRQGRSGQMPLVRQLSNGIASILISLFTGIRFHDSQCGFRALRVNLPGLNLCCEAGFQYESELLLRIGRMRCSFAQVPISTRYAATPSRIRYFGDTVRFLRLLWRVLWR